MRNLALNECRHERAPSLATAPGSMSKAPLKRLTSTSVRSKTPPGRTRTRRPAASLAPGMKKAPGRKRSVAPWQISIRPPWIGHGPATSSVPFVRKRLRWVQLLMDQWPIWPVFPPRSKRKVCSGKKRSSNPGMRPAGSPSGFSSAQLAGLCHAPHSVSGTRHASVSACESAAANAMRTG